MRSSPIDVAPSRTAYRGRFAPSPTGPLHAGSLVAALASWLDARAHDGCWLLRIEDLDPPREVPGAADDIVATLLAFGLEPDEPVARQSERSALYQAAVDRLAADGRLYACTCSRRTLELAAPGRAAYPGTCRHRGLPLDTPQAALRVRVDDVTLRVRDRSGAVLEQRLAHEVGDFVLRRADGWWAYQLAVVVDDAAQGITDVVRGADLWDNTPRQQWLHELLGTTAPRTLHVPVVTAATGEKLSKQTGAQPLDRSDVLGELRRAWQHLGFAPLGAATAAQFLRAALAPWRERWPLRGSMRR